ncbi:ATP-dependent RNA helicase HrpA [Vitreoscilla filiformis]|uniref:ATP-dependent RNA helicase HrpA n=1 Tax=Vitreoscilla filiformis TaxID=63 RepID=A0A221KGR4_VITFI|nr:ATP-dependent RNA helicase HrpA [Vitreoscilla filiformis]ASM78047.1 ATP-dependent RNA helicase HrpA [Vitreoscilla filiformis]
MSVKPFQRPANPVPPITFPENLPVSSRREDIAQALREHQVIIVCGETGSGKTTQLPKIALALGRGRGAGGKGLIGHTQPRRIAASSVAKRIADELNSPLGEVVGYKVRFQDRLQPGASVKLMTDGILLAETQTDPLLKAYDTLIIDEAHERSLNIDFLLGYLRQILPRRPDLKLIVTSATIDAERFAKHFASPKGDAPVLMVSGRTFPVEQRWRPFEDLKKAGAGSEVDQNEAIADAVDELWRSGPGDILVFLPGEREIREAADHLRKHLAQQHRSGPQPDILPLFARLSQQEQDRVFEPGNGRRVVLATNVAETSLTVPGIRYVIDTGLARVKRYSYRNKVEQLQIEAISQAAANQRAGRCGRVANGVCIRLYDEKDYAGRPRFTDPEILRSSLAGVILRMKSLGLGSVEDFPFLEAPPRKAIADGYALLNELGAVDDENQLTPMGQELAKLPLDPRVGRMILEARERHSLSEVLIIASALSGQDVRDRPLEAQQAADEKHKKFDDERSEFMGYLKLWHWIEEGRGHGDVAAAPSSRPSPARGEGEKAAVHKLSNRQQEQRLRDSFVNPRRVREWRDIHSQLHTVVAEHGWRLNEAPATYEQVHLAMLAGLLGNVGCKSDDEEWYLGARGIKFWRHPGAHLSKKPGRWLVAAELVDTTRLFGRGLAGIEPQWIVQVAGHLLKKQLLEPHWEKKAAEVIALERATLYGIVIYNNRRVNFGNVDAAAAREIFIREALVNGEWDTRLPFLAHNRKMIAQVEELEHKSRRQDVLVDDELIYAYYDQHVGTEVVSGATFERWYRHAGKANPKLLHLSREELMRHEAAGITTSAFPKTIRLGGVDCAASYLHQPGDAKDGVTVTVPIYALNQVSEERCEWLVPGMLEAKVLALVKSLHQRPRSRLVPLPDYAAEFCELAPFGQGNLVDMLLKAVRERTQLAVQRNDFKLEQVPQHLFMNFRVVDEHGRQLGMGRQLATLKAELGGLARSAFQALAGLKLAEAGAPSPQPSPTEGGGSQAQVQGRAGQAGNHAQPQRGGPTRSLSPSPLAGEGRGEGASTPTTPATYTTWTFGALPELMEIRKAGQTLIGFPALIDGGTHVEIEVFDEPAVAAAKHRLGLRRLVALQIKEPLKFLEKNIPDLTKMGVLYMPLGSAEELKAQIIELALDKAFLQEPLPQDAAAFAKRIEEGRGRLNLIAQEVARLAGTVLTEYATAARKLKDAKPPKDVADDITAQLQRLMPKRFLLAAPWAQLQHYARYLKGVVMRLDKLRTDPARDTQRLAELRPLEQRHQRRLAELKGQADARMDDFRWQLEELRVSLFAQELRTPQPVSVKRLEKVWSQVAG